MSDPKNSSATETVFPAGALMTAIPRAVASDVVGADAGAPDDLETPGAAKQLGGELGRAAADDGVVAADDVEEVAPGRGGALIDDKARLRAEELDAVGVDFVGDQDVVGAHWGLCDPAPVAVKRNVPIPWSFLQISVAVYLYF